MIKLMDSKEQQEAIIALGAWYDSQNINTLDAMQITMKVFALFIGACAPNIEELKIGLSVVQLDIEKIAMRAFIQKKKFDKSN